MKISELEQAVLRRSESLFAADLEKARDELGGTVGGARILVIGAAGSIGGAFVKVLAGFRPGARN